MTDVLKVAKDQFKARLAEELKFITVPEWGDKKIYYRSAMKLSQRAIVMKHVQRDEWDKCIAWGIIFRCRDENGKALFNRGHLNQIIDEFDPDVCQRIIEEMNANDPTHEEIQGN
jgi:hypothetical protein